MCSVPLLGAPPGAWILDHKFYKARTVPLVSLLLHLLFLCHAAKSPCLYNSDNSSVTLATGLAVFISG